MAVDIIIGDIFEVFILTQDISYYQYKAIRLIK